MAAIRGKDTVPERTIRRILHAMGFRFRLHRRDLPGRPDIVLPRHRLAILVHGCFWHRHPGCRFTTSPGTNVAFWKRKFRDNVRRDQLALARLKEAGWRTLVIWECALKIDSLRTSMPDVLRRAVTSDKLETQIPRVASRRRPRTPKH